MLVHADASLPPTVPLTHQQKRPKLTRITNHAITPAHPRNRFLVVLPPMAPRVLVLCRNARKLGVQPRTLAVVLVEALPAVRAEGVFVQWVYVDWGADLVHCAEVWEGG